jgi:hypothetical protein
LTEARVSPFSAAAGRAQFTQVLYRSSDPSVADAPVYQEVNARHGTMPSVTERWRSNMTQKELLPHALATAMMFLTLLGTVSCMTWHQAVTSAAGDVASTIDPAIDPGQSAKGKCEEFACEP